MSSGAGLLVFICGLGGGLVGFLLVVRHVDQRGRDARRRVYVVQFPRTVKAEHVAAFVQALSGLAAPRTGLLGRDTAVGEVVGMRDAIRFRLRLPEGPAGHYVGQLRAAVPGVAVTKLEPEAASVRVEWAQELRRTDPTGPLSAEDAAAVSRAVIAACGGLASRETVIWQWVVTGDGLQAADLSWRTAARRAMGWATTVPRKDEDGVIGAVLRIGATGRTHARTRGLVAGLGRVAGSVSAPGARLVPRRLPKRLVRRRLERAVTPLVESPVQVRPADLVALWGWPIGAPMVPGLVLGGSPQLPVSPAVPRGGRVLGEATVGGRRMVAQSRRAALEHSLYAGPTGSGKTWLAANVALGDISRGDGVLILDPKGGHVKAILERLPEEAVTRTVVVDPTDEERPVPLPLLATEHGGSAELAADTLVGLLRHRHRDLGPRSSDILTSSLYGLARMPTDPTIYDLLLLWSSPSVRARVAARVQDDPALASFFAWFEGLAPAERNFILAAPMNKIRPLLQRPVVRNVLAAPRATFTIGEALARRLVVLISLPEGVLGGDATSLLGQVVVARLWAAVQGRARIAEQSRRPYFVTIDEAPRFVDQPTDLGDVLARSREYAVGVTMIGQSLSQYPTPLREIALNSARTKVAFQSAAADARRLAPEFGPTVTPEMLANLAAFEAIGVVSVVGAVSEPFTLRTRPLPDKIPGRAKAVRAASRERWGVPRAEIEASFTRHQRPPESPGPVGRRVER